MQVMWVIHWGIYISAWVNKKIFLLPLANIIRTNTLLYIPKDLEKQFSVLKKCNDKFDCLVHKLWLIRELISSLITCSIRLNSRKTFVWLLHISHMLIISQKKPFWQFISKHFELGNGIKMTPKHHSFLPALFLTCFNKIIMPCNNFHGIANARHIIQCTCKWCNEHASI